MSGICSINTPHSWKGKAMTTEILDNCKVGLKALGYEVVEKNESLQVSKDGNGYTLDILDDGAASYMRVPVGVVDKDSLHLLNCASDCVGFVQNEASEKVLYIFKTNALAELLKPLVAQLKKDCKFGFTQETAEDFKRIHVRDDFETGGYDAYLHIPVKWATERVKNIRQVLQTNSSNVPTNKDDFNF